MARKQRTPEQQKRRRRILGVIEAACIIIVIVCAVLIFQDINRYVVANNDFDELAEAYDRDVERLETDNPNCVGWIYVEDTRIDYPVMYTPQDPEYYLHRNFAGEYSSSGTPFLGEGSTPDGNSLIIYGHHMRDGSMFATLLDFDDSSFGNSHIIEYKTTDGVEYYYPIAAFYVDLSTSGYYEYWNNVGTLDQETFEAYVQTVKELSMYTCTHDAGYGDKLLTLSTCSYGTGEERFVVVAVKADD